MITLTDIVQKMRNILTATDSEFHTWAMSILGSHPAVFVGLDVRNPPGSADCPMIVIRPISMDGGQESSERSYQVAVDWGLVDESVSSTAGATEFPGLYTVDGFGLAIWSALTGSFSSSVALSRSDYSLDPVEFFPMLLGGMDITITLPTVMGAEISL